MKRCIALLVLAFPAQMQAQPQPVSRASFDLISPQAQPPVHPAFQNTQTADLNRQLEELRKAIEALAARQSAPVAAQTENNPASTGVTESRTPAPVASPTVAQPPRHTYNTMLAAAKRDQCDLVIWVVSRCPPCEGRMTECHHARVDTFDGDATPRVIVARYYQGDMWKVRELPGLPSVEEIRSAMRTPVVTQAAPQPQATYYQPQYQYQYQQPQYSYPQASYGYGYGGGGFRGGFGSGFGGGGGGGCSGGG